VSAETVLLLDTCATIWIATEQPVTRHTTDAMDYALAAGDPIYISPLTAWEVGLLVSRGRINLQMPADRWFARLMEAPGLQLVDISPNVVIASSFLPGRPPHDPVDRILAATARERGLTLVTRDRRLLDYAEQGHLNALAC
jgi:PIN domain nuclease of toxin-antitoxin system